VQLDGSGFAPNAVEALRDVLPQLMFVTDRDGRTTYVNRPWFEYTGLSAEEATGAGWFAATEQAALDAARTAWQRAVSGGGAPFEARLRMRRGSDGASRWFLCRSSAVREADGTISSYVGTCTDVDDQARESERQRTLSEASRALGGAGSLDVRLRALARSVVPALGDWSAVVLVEEGRPTIGAVAHVDGGRDDELQALLGKHFAEELARAGGLADVFLGKPGLVPSIDAAYVEANVAPARRPAVEAAGFASLFAVPVIGREGVLGALYFAKSARALVHSAGDVEAAEEIARRTALSLENAYAQAELQRRAERLRFVAEASRALSESLDSGETLAALLRLIVPAQADWAVIHLAQPGGLLVPIATQHRDPDRADALAALVGVAGGSDWDAGATAAVGSGRPYLEVHASDDARVTLRGRAGDPTRAVGTLAFRARASVPLRAHGKIYGALTVARVERPGYGTADLDLLEEIAQRGALAVANAGAYEREHRVSTVLQTALLPASLPADGDFTFRAVYRPGSSEAQVGGDWYDALRLYDGRIVVSIGDVAGNGLAAAVTMASMRQIIRGIAQVQADPALMLDAADKVLRADAPERFVTAFVGVLDPVTLDFTFASAGHPPPFLRRGDGSIVALGASSLPLGLRRPMEGGTQTIELDEGSVLVFYTDGLTEATRDPIEGESRLRAALADPEMILVPDLAAALYERLAGSGSRDDVAIMTVAARTARAEPPGPGDRFTMRFDLSNAEQAHHARRDFVARLLAAHVDAEALIAAELIVGELLGNVVRHAPGRAEIVFDRQREAIVVHVIDRGHGFDVAPTLPRDSFSENGRGLFLISRLASDFQITRRAEDGSHARVVLATDAGPAGRPTAAASADDARLL